MTNGASQNGARASPRWQDGLRAITFDFGNTLVPVRHEALRGVVESTAMQVVERWDDASAAPYSTADEVAWATDVYSGEFVAKVSVPEQVGAMLERLAGRYRLAVLSNWPLAATIDRYVEAAGWSASLHAIVVSERVGTIKPHPAIFAAAAEQLDVPPETILHVGDDWGADVVGAKAAGWRAAYLRAPRGASPLPESEPDDRASADLELDVLTDLERALAEGER